MDTYKIAVRLAMTSNAAGVLSTLAQQILHVHAHVNSLQGGLNRVKLALGGGFAIAGGSAIISGLKAMTDHARELSHELATLRTFNISSRDIGRIQSQAQAVAMRVPGTTQSGNVKIAGEAYSMFGIEETLRIMQPLAKFAQVTGGITGNYERASEGLYSMLKSGDLMGKLVNEKTRQVDPDKLLSFLDMASKIEAATHGKVNPSTFMALAQQGGPALANMTNEGLMSMAMVAQAMGGFRGGTALTSLQQQFQAGTMTEARAAELHRLGLVGAYHTGRGGHLTFGKGALDTPFAQALTHDPAHAAEILQQALVKGGFKDIESQTKELFMILGRQTTQRIISDLIRNLPQMLAERGRMEGAQGMDAQAGTRNTYDLITAQHNLETAEKNFWEALAGPNASTEIAILNKMTEALNSLTQILYKTDPQVLQNIAIGFGALGVALVAGGGIAILAALGPAGWFTAGIIALGAAIAVFNPAAIKEIADDFRNLYAGVTQLSAGKFLSGLSDLIVKYFEGIPGLLFKPIQTALMNQGIAVGQSIAREIESWPGKIGPAIQSFGSQIIQKMIEGLAHLNPLNRTGFHGSGIGTSGATRASYIPPGRAITVTPAVVAVNLDGRKIGEAQLKFMARQGAGPAEGSPYHDGTYSTSPVDYSTI